MRLAIQMAASFCQIKTINPLSFYLSALTINRMLASTVFKKTKGTGFAYNKALKTTPFGRIYAGRLRHYAPRNCAA
ncbi:hypothetical protein [Alteromonas mediterranea]|uniref:hypothetical protein n=1 Tax=Alteromonas mediterranea TaxID=314275 RepID=UPI001E4FF6D9|nr:hypothetical protein [Alteromonas mediterranea]